MTTTLRLSAALATLGLAAALTQDARAQQTLYASNISGIDMISSAGAVTTFYGGAEFFGLAFDASGNLYAADASNKTIQKITPGGVASTFATDPNGNTFLAFGPAAAPEPSQTAALGVGLLGLGLLGLRARRRTA